MRVLNVRMFKRKNKQIPFVQSARTYPDKTRRKLKQADKSLRTKTVLSTPISALPTCKIIGFLVNCKQAGVT